MGLLCIGSLLAEDRLQQTFPPPAGAGDLPPVVAIPTTAGTGSEATKFTVITDTETGVKMLLKGEALIPKIAILNPEYTMDMPKAVTAALNGTAKFSVSASGTGLKYQWYYSFQLH